MAAKKKTSKKTITPRAGNLYELTAKGTQKLESGEFGPQETVIAKAMQSNGPLTTGQIAQKIESKLETKQPVTRVVGFYIGVWRDAGLARKAKAPKAVVAA